MSTARRVGAYSPLMYYAEAKASQGLALMALLAACSESSQGELNAPSLESSGGSPIAASMGGTPGGTGGAETGTVATGGQPAGSGGSATAPISLPGSGGETPAAGGGASGSIPAPTTSGGMASAGAGSGGAAIGGSATGGAAPQSPPAMCGVPSAPPATAVDPNHLPAFPGAEGYGSTTPGGRGGQVIEVTSLDDSGPGSLRAAVEQNGARTVVFRVSGTIELKSDLKVTNPNLTLAGQTAPGDGVCLKNKKFLIAANDVIVRHLRFRRGKADGERDDALAIEEAENVIVDHCTMSWGTDETLNTWHGSKNITISWSIVSEGLHHNDHGFAATLGGVNASYHHLLIANCPGRNPSVAGNNEHQTINMDFRNSVIFNFGHRTFDGKPSSVNIVNNYFKPGPNSTESVFADIDEAGVYSKIPTTAWYLSGNFWDGNPTISGNNSAGVQGAKQWLTEEPVAFAPVDTVPAPQAYDLVLAGAGATLPKRDSVDTRIIEEVKSGEPTFGKGVVLAAADVGGWPELKGPTPPADDDHDGMPNTWEETHGLNPADATDGAKLLPDGYSNLEHYINCIGQ